MTDHSTLDAKHPRTSGCFTRVQPSAKASPGADRRTDPRLSTGWLAEVATDAQRLFGVIQNVSLRGAQVRAEGALTVRPSDCVRLRFRLAETIRVTVCAKVRWVADDLDDDGRAEFGVQFYGLSRTEQEVIVQHAGLGGAADVATDVSVDRKHLVRSEGARLWIRLSGLFKEEESRALHAAVGKHVVSRFGRPLLAFIDVREIVTCPAESLPHFRRWLSMLGRGRPFSGVVLAEDSIASTQVRRLIREAGIGDSVVMFSERQQATEFCEALEQGLLGEGGDRCAEA